MNATHQLRRECRLCRSVDVEKVFSLAASPLANELLVAAEDASEQQKFPLDLYFCKQCTHLQLFDVISAERLFSHYVYVSGTAPSFRKHFAEYAAKIIADYKVEPDSLIVDIGSNDGTLLSAFKNSGMQVQGVDPAKEIAADANDRGIATIVDFFSVDIARQIKSARGMAKVVVANNVFAHIDDLEGILSGIDVLLAADGILVIEVSYLKDVIEKTLFDTIYHEHLDYHSVGPLQSFFLSHQFDIVDVSSIESHGGSIRVVAQKSSGGYAQQPSVAAFIAEEESLGLFSADTFRSFEHKINKLGDELKSLVASIKSQGKSIAGYGLPAKATTLMHQFDIGPDAIDYIVDDSPLKQGLYSPGYGIEINSSDRLKVDTPDFIIVLAWNFEKPIIENLGWFIEQGGTIIVPLPELKVVRKHD
ncbi:MAG: SAM-dependent methyltransferase [SAR86 cluster bacterium]|uniref:SAM-dependent methyltransferase n=1 Tax=SAR86 cluster bacterium TaxID=2030880 RepID=A0A2A4X2R8_9GAMM|nr:MAG: SAM-dependent methyltransferase [SAR86 cluster bacterium]